MRKWLVAIVSLFLFAVVLIPLATAQEEDDIVPPSPTELVTLQVIKPPQHQIRFVRPKYPARNGPNLDEGDEGDGNFNDPMDPFQTEGSSVHMTPASYRVANPTSPTVAGAGGAVLSAGRSGGSASSAQQDARRSIQKLIKRLY